MKFRTKIADRVLSATNAGILNLNIFQLLFLEGHGLPAGLAEVEMIERARAKRAW